MNSKEFFESYRNEKEPKYDLNTILDNVTQFNGQRIFKPNRVNDEPCRQFEIFIGRIPRDCNLERELVPLFLQAGDLYEFRLMMQFSGANRGFAFAMYTNYEDACNAVLNFNEYEIRPQWRLGVVHSMNNCRLYVSRLPQHVDINDLVMLFNEYPSEVLFMFIKYGITNTSIVIEFKNHRSAAIARKTIGPQVQSLWGQEVVVDWSLPQWQMDARQYRQMVKWLPNGEIVSGPSDPALMGNDALRLSNTSYKRSQLLNQARTSSYRKKIISDSVPRIYRSVSHLQTKMMEYIGDTVHTNENQHLNYDTKHIIQNHNEQHETELLHHFNKIAIQEEKSLTMKRGFSIPPLNLNNNSLHVQGPRSGQSTSSYSSFYDSPDYFDDVFKPSLIRSSSRMSRMLSSSSDNSLIVDPSPFSDSIFQFPHSENLEKYFSSKSSPTYSNYGNNQSFSGYSSSDNSPTFQNTRPQKSALNPNAPLFFQKNESSYEPLTFTTSQPSTAIEIEEPFDEHFSYLLGPDF